MRLCLALAGLAVILAARGEAQQLIDPVQQTLRGMERERTIERLENSTQGQAIAGNPSLGPVREANCYPINRIVITGVSLIDPSTIEPIERRYRGRCLGERSISALLSEINSAYAERGYITTRAYLPEQNLRAGTLSLKVLEGRIEKVIHKLVAEDGTETAAPPGKTWSAMPTGERGPLNLRDLEQALDTINRLTSSQSALDLAPGETEGGSIVIIKEQKKDRLRAFVGADNAGSISTGSYRARIAVEGDDLLYLNDAWALSLITSENANGLTGTVSLPLGYTQVALGGTYFESQDELTTTALLYSQTANVSAGIERLVWRDSATKLRVHAGLQHFWNQRLINTAILTPSQRTAARIGGSAEIHWPGNVAQVDVGFSHGVPALLGLDKLQGDPAITPNLAFTKLDLSAYWIRALGWGRIVINGQAQFARDVLLSPDQLIIGGWDSVRGYQGAEAAGDRGALVRAELILNMPEIATGVRVLDEMWCQQRKKLEPFLFTDAARVWSLASEKSEGMLGIGGGLRVNSERLRLEVAAGAPLIDVPGLTDRWQAYGNVTIKLY